MKGDIKCSCVWCRGGVVKGLYNGDGTVTCCKRGVGCCVSFVLMMTMVMALTSTLVGPARRIRVGMKSERERGGMRGRHKRKGRGRGKHKQVQCSPSTSTTSNDHVPTHDTPPSTPCIPHIAKPHSWGTHIDTHHHPQTEPPSPSLSSSF